MKAKLAIATTTLIAAFAAGATDFVWTGNTQYAEDWFDSGNWELSDGTPADTYPQSGDKATFNKDAALNVNSDITVGTLVLNANLTHKRDKWLTVGAIEGTGEIILTNRGRLRNINGTAVECNNNIRIINSDGSDWDSHDRMPWIQGNGANFDIKGSLLGDGHVFLTMSGYFGVRLYGDNSAWEGTVYVDGNSSNRMKFGEAIAGSANAKWHIHGSVTDNGSMLFSNGTINFGSIYTSSYATGAYFRSIDKHNTLIVGNLNSESDRITIGMGDDANAYAKIVKVGTGTLELGPTRHREGTIISNGTIRVTHPDGICHKDSDLTFDGGTLQYGLNPLDGNNPVTKDVSSCVKNSTEWISVDTSGNDITWASENLYTRNTNAVGIAKKGDGTLTLSGSNREGTWKFLSQSLCTNYIYGGVLAIRNGKRSSTPGLESRILGNGTLRIESEEDNGGYRIWGNTAHLDEFEGTIEWSNEITEADKAVGFMLNNANLDMSRAKFRVTGNPDSETIVMNGEANNTRWVKVDAFDHLYPNAHLKMKSPWQLNILGTKGDSYLNGTITGAVVTVTKTGPGKLTMGPGFTAPAGSSVNVNEGVFAMDASMTQSDLPSYVTIASGVAFTGEGVFGDVNLSVNDVIPPALTAETDKAAEFTLLTATSFTGTSAAMTTLLDEVNASVTGGKWKLSRVNNGDGTVTLKCRFVKSAFVIVFR